MATKTISFVLNAEITPELRADFLQRVQERAGVERARYLCEDRERTAWRIGHVTATAASAAKLCKAISEDPDVEAAQIEVPRGLT